MMNPPYFKTLYFPLSRFDYLWMAPHIAKKNNRQNNERLLKRQWWEKALPSMRIGMDEDDNRIIRVYNSFMEKGQLNHLIGHEVNGIVYLVDKGNRALCVLRAIRMRVEEQTARGAPLTPREQAWKDQGFESIAAKICCPCNDWSHDCPAARFHDWQAW